MTSNTAHAASPTLLSIRELASRRSGAAALQAFTSHAREIAAASHLALLHEFDHQDDPLMLWVVHREADSRDLPPCLRWGTFTRAPQVSLRAPAAASQAAQEEEAQRLFVNWLADMLWLTTRDRTWRPAESAWSPLFEQTPNSAPWHAYALDVFQQGSADFETFATRLGLTKRTRQSTLTLTNRPIESERAQLADRSELKRRLTAYATTHPDRSATFTPAQVVERRLLAHRVFVLAGKQQGLAAQYLSLLTGQSVSRQAFTRQLEAITASTSDAPTANTPDIDPPPVGNPPTFEGFDQHH